METHFTQNAPGADITALLQKFAARFFSEAEKAELRRNHDRLVEVLAELEQLAEAGARGREAFETASARVAADDGMTLAERMAELEALRDDQSKTPERAAALHSLENTYHQFFVPPAQRLTEAFVAPLWDQVTLAEATEKDVAAKFGIPLARIEGALAAPLRRAHLDTKSARMEPGGAASWLARAGLFLLDDDLPAAAPNNELAMNLNDELAMNPSPKMPPGMTRRLPVPRGMGAPA